MPSWKDTLRICELCDNYKGENIGCESYDSNGDSVCKRSMKSRSPDFRAQVLAEEGIISGQIAYFILYGEWPELINASP